MLRVDHQVHRAASARPTTPPTSTAGDGCLGALPGSGHTAETAETAATRDRVKPKRMPYSTLFIKVPNATLARWRKQAKA